MWQLYRPCPHLTCQQMIELIWNVSKFGVFAWCFKRSQTKVKPLGKKICGQQMLFSCWKLRIILLKYLWFLSRCYARLHPRAVNCRKKKCGHSNQVTATLHFFCFSSIVLLFCWQFSGLRYPLLVQSALVFEAM